MELSIVPGGPLNRLLARAHLLRPPLALIPRRIGAILLLTWVPLLILAIIQPTPAGLAVPFLADAEVHSRFLITLPLLILVERPIHERLGPAAMGFLDRGIILPADQPAFAAAARSATRLADSILLELMLIALIIVVGRWVWYEHSAVGRTSWFAIRDPSIFRLTAAGAWYAFVSVPIFQFILLRWYLRLFIWFRFLWRVSRLRLQLTAAHPDRAAGLAFVGHSSLAFIPFLFAQGVLLAGMAANRVFHDGRTLGSLQFELVIAITVLVLLIIAPLSMFTPPLILAKRRGRDEYGALASRYLAGFENKWVRPRPPLPPPPESDEPLVGSSDIQSLADMGNSYSLVRQMRPSVIGVDVVAPLLIATAIPLLPLLLAAIPLSAIVQFAIKALF